MMPARVDKEKSISLKITYWVPRSPDMHDFVLLYPVKSSLVVNIASVLCTLERVAMQVKNTL